MCLVEKKAMGREEMNFFLFDSKGEGREFFFGSKRGKRF